MALTIPASDLEGTKLNNIVNNLTTLIAANPSNIALINQQYSAQRALVQYLLSQGSIVPSVILAGSGATYVGPGNTGQGGGSSVG